MTDLRTRIIAALKAHQRDEGEPSGYCDCGDIVFSDEMTAHQADAVIRELDGVLVDWGLWLSEEITGRQMTRIDMESCVTDWKATMSDNLLDRITRVMNRELLAQLPDARSSGDDLAPSPSGTINLHHLADAVIRELDLENRITSAICGYAGSEQMALTYHDANRGGTEFEALTRLISEAPKIARYAMKYRPDWKANDE